MRTHTSTIELCKDHAYKLQHKLYTEGNAGHIDEQATAQGDCAMFGHAPAEFVMHILEDVPTPELTPEQEQMKARIEQILAT